MPFKHILYAEDDTDDAVLLEEAIMISSPGCEITHVENGLKVLDYLEKGTVPDLFIIDLNMPKLNGLECISLLRLNGAVQHIPILVLSTSKNKSEIKACFDLGADYYIAKPDTFEGILAIGKSIAAGNIVSTY